MIDAWQRLKTIPLFSNSKSTLGILNGIAAQTKFRAISFENKYHSFCCILIQTIFTQITAKGMQKMFEFQPKTWFPPFQIPTIYTQISTKRVEDFKIPTKINSFKQFSLKLVPKAQILVQKEC